MKTPLKQYLDILEKHCNIKPDEFPYTVVKEERFRNNKGRVTVLDNDEKTEVLNFIDDDSFDSAIIIDGKYFNYDRDRDNTTEIITNYGIDVDLQVIVSALKLNDRETFREFLNDKINEVEAYYIFDAFQKNKDMDTLKFVKWVCEAREHLQEGHIREDGDTIIFDLDDE